MLKFQSVPGSETRPVGLPHKWLVQPSSLFALKC